MPSSSVACKEAFMLNAGVSSGYDVSRTTHNDPQAHRTFCSAQIEMNSHAPASWGGNMFVRRINSHMDDNH